MARKIQINIFDFEFFDKMRTEINAKRSYFEGSYGKSVWLLGKKMSTYTNSYYLYEKAEKIHDLQSKLPRK